MIEENVIDGVKIMLSGEKEEKNLDDKKNNSRKVLAVFLILNFALAIRHTTHNSPIV